MDEACSVPSCDTGDTVGLCVCVWGGGGHELAFVSNQADKEKLRGVRRWKRFFVLT